MLDTVNIQEVAIWQKQFLKKALSSFRTFLQKKKKNMKWNGSDGFSNWLVRMYVESNRKSLPKKITADIDRIWHRVFLKIYFFSLWNKCKKAKTLCKKILFFFTLVYLYWKRTSWSKSANIRQKLFIRYSGGFRSFQEELDLNCPTCHHRTSL